MPFSPLSMNPISTIGGFANNVITAGGQVAQQAAGAAANVKSESMLVGAAGPSKAESAQSAAMEKADASQARLIGLQSEADINKQRIDTATAIQQGRDQSFGKAMSSMNKSVDSINF